MMNFISKDAAMVEILEQMITQLTTSIENTGNYDAKSLVDQLSLLLQQLKQQLSIYQEPYFSYEFYNVACDLVEIITNLRLQKAWRDSLQPLNGMSMLDDSVHTLKTAVFRHEVLADPLYHEPAATAHYPDKLSAAQANIESATRRASAATAATERANVAAAKILESIQAAQNKTGGDLASHSIDQSLQITIELCARNAAAVIAADEVASAIIAYEELLGNER